MAVLPDSKKLLNKLERYLRPGRVEHSRNVAQVAVELAQLHAPKLLKTAEIAGLTHDNAKQLKPKEMLELAKRHCMEVNEFEKAYPQLLHGKVGAALLPERFGINDPDVIQAVADHVTGRTGMGVLSLILFAADQCAADRSFPGVEDVREAAQVNLHSAAWLVARHKLMWTAQRKRLIEPRTVEVYNELLTFAPKSNGQLGVVA